MKKIVLLGDSIRMGYDKYVKEALSDTAKVFYPEENCKFALNILRCVVEWKRNGGWGDDVDLVHWNAGLWDCVEVDGDAPLTPLAWYEETVARVDKRLRAFFPKAKIVFATSTSVCEEKYTPDFLRHNAIIEAYNAAALRVLSATDTVINDLYALTKTFPESYRSDATHFYTNEGIEQIGGRVLSVICDTLAIHSAEVNIENFAPERYSAKNIGN